MDPSFQEESWLGSPSRLQLGRHWLERCQTHHRRCRAWTTDNSPLPTRVIDVGSIEGTEQPVLHESRAGETAPYLALSHSWGKAQILMTTTETLEERKRGIPLDRMPRTFRDAVVVTRSLGFRYLWIDSLCILQNDQDDWRNEAGKMGLVYRHAAVTIVAAASTGADSGCFQQLRDGSVFPCKIGTVSLPASACAQHSAHAISVYAHSSYPRTPMGRDDAFRPRGPLDDRGWVLQEELLSGRMLVFSSHGLFWECSGMDASEFLPFGKKPLGGRATLTRLGSSIRPASVSLQLASPPMRYALNFKRYVSWAESGQHSLEFRRKYFYAAWKEIVENYTSRALTIENDRYVAIQGLVDAVSPSLEDSCYAGLWVSDLASQLLWRVDEQKVELSPCPHCGTHAGIRRTRRERRKSEPIGSPSWSWAGVNQRVTYSDARCVTTLVTLRGLAVWQQDVFNNVIARLTMSAMLVPVRLPTDGGTES